MHLVPLLGLAALTFAAPSPPRPEQLVISAESSIGIPTSAVSLKLAQLPLDHLEQLYQHVDRWTEPRILRLRAHNGSRGELVSVSEGEKSLLTLAGIRYVDVTTDVDDDIVHTPRPVPVSDPYPTKLSHSASSLSPLFKSISLASIEQFLKNFTSFHSRYYRSQSGRDSQLYLLQHLRELHSTLNPKANLTFREFNHEWVQKSIIARWEPIVKSNDYKDEVVILSAHQDSTNSLPFLPAPGADDDASGTSTLVSTLTQLLSHDFHPVIRPIEFHFYSAEEGGLLGSNQVAKSYRDQGKTVKAMFHMDVVAYVKPGTEPVIGMITDGTNHDLVQFMKLVVNEYATIPYAETQCGYGCSDFASFTKYGYPSTCLAEGKFADSNPNMHSMRDTINAEGYSLEHIREFVRVAIGYAVELGGMEKSSARRTRDGRWRME